MHYHSLMSPSYLAGALAGMAEDFFGVSVRNVIMQVAYALGANRGRFDDGFDAVLDSIHHNTK